MGGFNYHPFRGNRFPPPPPSHWKQSEAYTLLMLCTECQATHSSWLENESTWWASDRQMAPQLSHRRESATGMLQAWGTRTCSKQRRELPPTSFIEDRKAFFYWFEGYLPELTWFCNCSVRFTWPYPDTSIEAFLKLGVANSSKTLVSGSCLFSSHLQILQSLLDWKKWILSIFHYKHYIMPWERIQQQTRQCSRGRQGPVKCPARLWHLLIAWIHE